MNCFRRWDLNSYGFIVKPPTPPPPKTINNKNIFLKLTNKQETIEIIQTLIKSN